MCRFVGVWGDSVSKIEPPGVDPVGTLHLPLLRPVAQKVKQ